jgi:hypothetical protein
MRVSSQSEKTFNELYHPPEEFHGPVEKVALLGEIDHF